MYTTEKENPSSIRLFSSTFPAQLCSSVALSVITSLTILQTRAPESLPLAFPTLFSSYFLLTLLYFPPRHQPLWHITHSCAPLFTACLPLLVCKLQESTDRCLFWALLYPWA